MFIGLDEAAQILEVSKTTVWRWAREAQLQMPYFKQDFRQQRQQVPMLALINFLYEKGKIPFLHVEKGAFQEGAEIVYKPFPRTKKRPIAKVDLGP